MGNIKDFVRAKSNGQMTVVRAHTRRIKSDSPSNIPRDNNASILVWIVVILLLGSLILFNFILTLKIIGIIIILIASAWIGAFIGKKLLGIYKK